MFSYLKSQVTSAIGVVVSTEPSPGLYVVNISFFNSLQSQHSR